MSHAGKVNVAGFGVRVAIDFIVHRRPLQRVISGDGWRVASKVATSSPVKKSYSVEVYVFVAKVATFRQLPLAGARLLPLLKKREKKFQRSC
jgi:hypothetical protein